MLAESVMFSHVCKPGVKGLFHLKEINFTVRNAVSEM